jgi:hypothetical protein
MSDTSAVIFVTVARPVQIAEGALAGEIAQPRRRQRRQMRIRQMCEAERRHHAIPSGLSVKTGR